MEENPLEVKVKEFCNYLIEIGLLNISIYKDFIKKFKEINENGVISSGNEKTDMSIGLIYFKDNISKTIVEFYNSLSEERKKIIALNIFSKYNNKKDNNEINKSQKSCKKIIEYKIEKISPINFIKINRNYNKIENNNKDKNNYIISNNNKKNIKRDTNNATEIINSNIHICRRNNSFITKKSKKFDLENKKINIDKSHEKNKNENFSINRNCTFHPNTRGVNNNASNLSKKNLSFDKNNSNVFERLSKKSERKKQDIENLKNELNKENIFQPNVHKLNLKMLKRENFEQRLIILEERKKNKEQKRKEEEEKEFQEKFPFNPKPYNCFKASYKRNNIGININIHQKLYDDNKKSKQRKEDRIKQEIKDIRYKANHPIAIHNNITYLYNKGNNIEINDRKRNRNNSTNNIRIQRKKINEKKKMYKIDYINYKTEEKNKKEGENEKEYKKIEQLYKEYKKIKNEFDLKQDSEKKMDNININIYGKKNDNSNIENDEMDNSNNSFDNFYNTNNIENKEFSNIYNGEEIIDS